MDAPYDRTADSTVAHSIALFSGMKLIIINAVIDDANNTPLPAIQNAQLKDLVTKVAPAFAAHRDRAQSLLDQQK